MPNIPLALFVPDDRSAPPPGGAGGTLVERVTPTEYARGPWSPDAQHGGPPSALVARAAERALGPAFHIARLTVELHRAVPLAPLVVSATVPRPGRKVALADIALTDAASGVEVVRARALGIRHADIDVPTTGGAAVDPAPPGPENGVLERAEEAFGDQIAFHRDSAEHRFVTGSWTDLGPVVVWIRLRVPVVLGEEPTGLQRVAAVADFGSGVSYVLPFDRYTFINPDLTISLSRPATGEWICLDARTILGGPGTGTGIADATLYDGRGRIGRSVQCLLVDERPS